MDSHDGNAERPEEASSEAASSQGLPAALVARQAEQAAVPLREEQVANAVAFLTNAKVMVRPVASSRSRTCAFESSKLGCYSLL
jgi:hypothetical protein